MHRRCRLFAGHCVARGGRGEDGGELFARDSKGEELVTSGVYAFFRHPSYTGWFYYCISREVILQNPLGFLFSTIMNWALLYYRIPYEEKCLLSFFAEYEDYRKRTHVFIPFIPVVEDK